LYVDPQSEMDVQPVVGDSPGALKPASKQMNLKRPALVADADYEPNGKKKVRGNSGWASVNTVIKRLD
jgi:hypothetical protein